MTISKFDPSSLFLPSFQKMSSFSFCNLITEPYIDFKIVGRHYCCCKSLFPSGKGTNACHNGYYYTTLSFVLFQLFVSGGISNFRCTRESKINNFPRPRTSWNLMVALHELTLWREADRLFSSLRPSAHNGNSCFGAIRKRSFNRPDKRVSISISEPYARSLQERNNGAAYDTEYPRRTKKWIKK